MLNVKVSMRGGGPVPDLSQFVGTPDNSIEGCRFFVNLDARDADVWIVTEDVDDNDTTCRVPPSRIAYVTAETSWEPCEFAVGTKRGEFVSQFPHVYSCHDIYQEGVRNVPPFLPWMINSNHGASMFAPHERDVNVLRDLDGLQKSRPLSVFCSAQTLTANHRMRLRFVEALKNHFGDSLDWYGNGINSLPRKWEGIAPYRYTIVLENQSTANLFTEKIGDAYLGLAYPIYWGAPNIGDYFDERSYTAINIRDFAGSISTIEAVLNSELDATHRADLIESKRRVLDDYNVFRRLALVAHELVDRAPLELPRTVRLEPVESFAPPRRTGPRDSLGRAFLGVGRRLTRPDRVPRSG